MNFRWIAATLVLVLALSAGGITYLCLREPLPEAAAQNDDALLWLRHEFQLPAERMARIESLHDAYRVVCDEHCRMIREMRTEIRELRDRPVTAEETAAVQARAGELDIICKTSLEAHLREVAAVIGGDDGARYLAIVLPRIASFDHAGTPDLDFATADPHAGHAHH